MAKKENKFDILNGEKNSFVKEASQNIKYT